MRVVLKKCSFFQEPSKSQSKAILPAPVCQKHPPTQFLILTFVLFWYEKSEV